MKPIFSPVQHQRHILPKNTKGGAIFLRNGDTHFLYDLEAYTSNGEMKLLVKHYFPFLNARWRNKQKLFLFSQKP